MNEEIQAAEDKSMMDITEQMLFACDNKRIDLCLGAAFSVIGTIIGQNPALTELAVANMRKLADYIEKKAKEPSKQPSVIVTH